MRMQRTPVARRHPLRAAPGEGLGDRPGLTAVLARLAAPFDVPPCGACNRRIWIVRRSTPRARLSRWHQHVTTVLIHPRCARALTGLAERTATPGTDRVAALLAAVVAAGGWQVQPDDTRVPDAGATPQSVAS